MVAQGHHSTFESLLTLEGTDATEGKSSLVKTLQDLSLDDTLPIAGRLLNIKRVVMKPTFETIMLNYHNYDSLTFSWLKQCLVSFIELIGLYTPEHKKCYNQLLNAVEPQAIGVRRFGLFPVSTPRPANDSSPLVEPTTQPVLA